MFRSYDIVFGSNIIFTSAQCRHKGAGCAMGKSQVIPSVRLRVKTPAKAAPKKPTKYKQKPRNRLAATLNPLPDLNVSRVLLPQVQPCDAVLEYKKYHLTKTDHDSWIHLDSDFSAKAEPF